MMTIIGIVQSCQIRSSTCIKRRMVDRDLSRGITDLTAGKVTTRIRCKVKVVVIWEMVH